MRKLLTRDLYRPSGPAAFHLALSTFGLLALELALIRWLASQMRLFAYFSNLVLIAAFLGMGLGLGIAKRRGELRHWVLPALLLIAIPAAFAAPLGLTSLTFPDFSIHIWGAGGVLDTEPGNFSRARELLESIFIVLVLFWATVATFVPAGVSVGHFFSKMRPLKAYGFDLLGSLIGVLAIGVVTWLTTGPTVWFFVACVPFFYLSPRLINAICFAGVLLAAWSSVDGALFSAYNRIDLMAQAGLDVQLNVNRDFHQYIHDFSPERFASVTDPTVRSTMEATRAVYDMPFLVANSARRVLIVGAGTGNDVQGALRNGAEKVVAVDIDGTIVKLGRVLHPEEPYSNPAVETVVNDGRAYLEQYQGEPFDVVSFGLVDSHALFSAMSSLRLETYIYTQEGLRAAWDVLDDEGLLSLAFSVAGGPWVADRLYRTLEAATGKEPVVMYHGLHGGATFFVTKAAEPPNLEGLRGSRVVPTTLASEIGTTTDDWPFLYIRPGLFPWGYVLLLSAVLLTSLVAVTASFGRDVVGGGFDRPLFFMGAAFLLLETRGVTSLSLLFGSTWVVNSVVFAGILTTVLVANWAVDRFEPTHESRWFVPLFVALAVLWVVPVGALNALPMVGRGVLGGLLVGLPVGIAGVIVSIRLRRVRLPTAALGSNLLGAVVGGCLEYLSMWTGLRALVLLAAAFYILSLVFIRVEGREATESASVSV
jgi:spermidine synthase